MDTDNKKFRIDMKLAIGKDPSPASAHPVLRTIQCAECKRLNQLISQPFSTICDECILGLFSIES